MDLGLSDRVYVVTGGSRGLGRAAAETLVADGARVVLAARNRDSLDATVAELGADRATGVVADLTDPATPQRLVDAALAAYGRLDGGLVSVGGPPAGTVMATADEAWATAFESVFLGAVRMARTLAGALVEGGGESGGEGGGERGGERGSLALVLSTSTKAPLDNLAISNGFRPGLGMVVKTLADEVGPLGVRVNALLPGRLETERVRELDASTGDADAARRGHERTIPLRRYGLPEEFGRVAAFVLSPASSFVTGTMVPVDGGLHRAL